MTEKNFHSSTRISKRTGHRVIHGTPPYADVVKRSLRAVIIGAVVVALVVVGGPFVYINVFRDDAPAALTLEKIGSETIPAETTPAAAIDDINGDWTLSTESIVGYRVKEVLFGQNTEAVGRTSSVAGSLTIAGTQVNKAEFTVEMGTLQSDSGRRDGQFNGRIMDVATYPTATFTLTSPIELPDNAASGEVINTKANGDLTLRGLTKPVSFDVQAQVSGQTFTVVGNITIVFDEWGIPEPGFGNITVEPDGLLEFALVFSRPAVG